MYVSLCVREEQGATCVSEGRFWYWLGYSARGKDKACQVSRCGCVCWVPRFASRVWVERDYNNVHEGRTTLSVTWAHPV